MQRYRATGQNFMGETTVGQWAAKHSLLLGSNTVNFTFGEPFVYLFHIHGPYMLTARSALYLVSQTLMRPSSPEVASLWSDWLPKSTSLIVDACASGTFEDCSIVRKSHSWRTHPSVSAPRGQCCCKLPSPFAQKNSLGEEKTQTTNGDSYYSMGIACFSASEEKGVLSGDACLSQSLM